MISIKIEGLSKVFNMPSGRRVKALENLSLSIKPGEFFFILGPSGCGKTTLLRIIAGFIQADSGSIRFDGIDVTTTPAHKRHAAMVFQNYALFPHLNVKENVAYGLRVRKVSGSERASRINEALRLVRMEDFSDSLPSQLSGGQQQRIALARALVVNPRAVLLDEPLSNLDARLREAMRSELREIHEAARATTVYVTHDRKEALSLGDRIALMNAGRIEQAGTAEELYTRPRNRFVAEFMGEANLIPGTVTGIDPWGEFKVLTALGLLSGYASGDLNPALEQRVLVMIRPEWIELSDKPSGRGLPVECRVLSKVYTGDKLQVRLACPDDITLNADLDARLASSIRQGDLVEVLVPQTDVCVLSG